MTHDETIPLIEFDPAQGTLLIEGKSIPENPIKIFQPLMVKIVEYVKNPAPKTCITLKFEYINTSSVKWIFHILEKLENVYVQEKRVVEIKFYYSDENTLETGKYLQMNMAIPIDLIKC